MRPIFGIALRLLLTFFACCASGCYSRSYTIVSGIYVDGAHQYSAVRRIGRIDWPLLRPADATIVSDDLAVIEITPRLDRHPITFPWRLVSRQPSPINAPHSYLPTDDFLILSNNNEITPWPKKLSPDRDERQRGLSQLMSENCGYLGQTSVIIRNPVHVDVAAPPCQPRSESIAIHRSNNLSVVCTVDLPALAEQFPGNWPSLTAETGEKEKVEFEDSFRLKETGTQGDFFLYREYSRYRSDSQLWPVNPPGQIVLLHGCSLPEKVAKFELQPHEYIIDIDRGAELVVLTEQWFEVGQPDRFRIRIFGRQQPFELQLDAASGRYMLDAANHTLFSYDEFPTNRGTLKVSAVNYLTGEKSVGLLDLASRF